MFNISRHTSLIISSEANDYDSKYICCCVFLWSKIVYHLPR